MERVIKFRVYNSQEGMIYDHLDCFMSIDRDGTLNDSGTPENHVMQYTGLKDKHGKEIYDNDLVQDERTIYKVEWNQQNGKWCLKPIELINGNELEIVDFMSYQDLGNGYYSRREIEIIGNIHQTP